MRLSSASLVGSPLASSRQRSDSPALLACPAFSATGQRETGPLTLASRFRSSLGLHELRSRTAPASMPNPSLNPTRYGRPSCPCAAPRSSCTARASRPASAGGLAQTLGLAFNFLMTPALQEYLETHSFIEVADSGGELRSVSAREYLNSQFCVRVINERNLESYVQVGPVAVPRTYLFLNGVVAFLTNDDAATRTSGREAERLAQHHEDIAVLFAASPEGEACRSAFAVWQGQFAAREQARLASEAGRALAARKPWWKLW